MLEHTLSHLKTFITQHLASEPTAGIALAITDRGRTLHVGTYGYANLDAQTPVRPDHLFQIGSIGKSFTAIALLQLYEQGKLDLHAPVTHYLPWLEVPTKYAPITLHHLLTHTAGIVTGTDEAPTMFGEAWNLRHTSTGCAPGEHFHYSNSGYKVLGLVLESLTGQPYAQTIREHILTPLGMQTTEAAITHATRARHATGYLPFPDDQPIPRPFTDKSRLAPAPWFETGTADGCITSTPGDMAAYLRALLNYAGGLLQPDTFRLMTTPYIQSDSKDHAFQYGYGLDIIEKDGHTQIAHGGGMVGYFAYLLGDVKSGLGVIVLMNGPGGTYPVAEFVLNTLLAVYENGPPPEIPAPKTYPEVDRTAGDTSTPYPSTWDTYPGKYVSHNPWYPHFRIVHHNGTLTFSLPWEEDEDEPLTEIEPGLFRIGKDDWNPERLHFEAIIDGNATQAVFSGARYYRSFTQ